MPAMEETPLITFPNPFQDPALILMARKTGLIPQDEENLSVLTDLESDEEETFPDTILDRSSDSEDDIPAHIYGSRLLSSRVDQMAPTFAKSIRSSNNKSPPTLSAGKVTSDVLKTWERGCTAYFSQKKVAAGDQVRHVLDSFEETRTINWVGHRREELAKLKFPEFMKILRKHALENEWHLELKKKLQRRTQSEDEAFEDFANEVCHWNTLLVDAPKSSFSNERLHEILLAGAHDDINELYSASDLPDKYADADWEDAEADVLNDWIADVIKIDRRVANERKRARKLLEERKQKNKKFGGGGSIANTAGNGTGSGGGEGQKKTWIPALTEDERKVLQKHHGCFKCRKFYTGHGYRNCENGFPDKHVQITEADGQAARPANFKSPGKRTLPVGAVVGSSVIYESDSEESRAGGSGSEADELDTDTKMKPEHIPLTAVTTPFGLYEFVVMPMGFRNAPSIHQRRVSRALKAYIGKFCHVYLDDIIIWSDTVEEHLRHVRLVLEALRAHKLYLNPKKCKFLQTSINFLGHIVSGDGIRPDGSKVERILSWPTPTSSTDVRKFLGLVRYIAAFLPNLAEHTMVLNTLTTKECDKVFPEWREEHQVAFEAIKTIVTSPECLTVIDHANPGNNRIFLTTDASDTRMGAVLSYGPTWQEARPVAFDSVPFRGAELNYPVHEKELLAIVTALKKWRADLLGSEFFIYTDHRTLENFHKQRDFSRRQARWMEYMSQFEGRIVYVKGDDNSVADALSRLPTTTCTREAEATAAKVFDEKFMEDGEDEALRVYPVCAVLTVDRANTVCAVTDLLKSRPNTLAASLPVKEVTMNDEFVALLQEGYRVDPWCLKFESAARGMSSFQNRAGLWFVNGRLVIPDFGNLRGILFQLAHDRLGHFGFKKAYATLRHDYYWPNMRTDLEVGYIPACEECQRNKDSTRRPAGPLHPLPVPDGRCQSIAMDFVGPLPLDGGYDTILTITDRLGSDIQLVPCKSTLTAPELAELFFDRWYCENGMPEDIVSDRDKLFTSSFWRSLHALTGIKLKCSTLFHPQTDGSSERTNKTVVQALRYFVDRAQKGWAKALARPPELGDTISALGELQDTVADARDALVKAKVDQAAEANKTRRDDPEFDVGERVWLCTRHRRREYLAKGQKRVAKFMPRYDGPYLILDRNLATSTYTLLLPEHSNTHPTFHVAWLKKVVENDAKKWPERERRRPGAIVTEDGTEEWEVEKIIDERRRGKGSQYLVRWAGYGPECDTWLPAKEVEDCQALDVFQGLVEGRTGSTNSTSSANG
ncbi:hypothetical protein H1R20_g1983, partial [Candolleomyces eurysporus]